MLDVVATFLSRYLYAILLSTVTSVGALIAVKLVSKRAYKKRTLIFLSPLLGSFLIAVWISSICFSHWFTMSKGELYHIACSDVSFSYEAAICTSWIAMFGASFSFAFLYAIISYHFSENFVTWLFHIRYLREDQALNLYKILSSLSQKACVETPKVGLIERSTPFVFTIGRKGKSTIVVSVGFLETLSSNEIEASLAHEISHTKNEDCLIKSFASGLKFAVPFNLLGYLIEPAIYRDREFLADEESARMTRKPRALISALIKLYESFAVRSKNGFFPDFSMRLFAQGTGRYGIFSKHPSIAERLERLLEFENENLS